MTLWLVPITLTLAACSRSSGPVEELRSLFEALGNPSFSASRLGSQVYAVLDEPSRNAIDARAAALGEQLKTKVEPDEVLQLHGFAASGRVKSVEVLEREGDRATLEVALAPLVFEPTAVAAPPAPTSAPAKTEAPKSLKLRVVREGGRWRVALSELAGFISNMSLAQGTP